MKSILCQLSTPFLILHPILVVQSTWLFGRAINYRIKEVFGQEQSPSKLHPLLLQFT